MKALNYSDEPDKANEIFAKLLLKYCPKDFPEKIKALKPDSTGQKDNYQVSNGIIYYTKNK